MQMSSSVRRPFRAAWLTAVAGLTLPLSARAQFTWMPQTNTPEWNHTQLATIQGQTVCLNNWNGGVELFPTCPPFPSAASDAILPSGSVVNIASIATCRTLIVAPGAALTLQGSELVCAGTSIGSTFFWSDGTIRNCPNFLIEAPGLQVFTPGNKFLHNTRLATSGDVAWSGGNIFLGNGSVIENSAGWNASSDHALQPGGGVGTPRFENTGTFTKSAGVGITAVSVPFHNTNQVRAFSGSIRFNSTTTSDTGAFMTQPGTAIDFYDTVAFNTGTTLAGGGLCRVYGSAAVNALVLADHLQLHTGNIAINPAGDLRVLFTMDWLGGTLGDGGGIAQVIPPATLTLSGPSDKSLSRVTLRNDGHLAWAGGNWFLSNGATLLDNRNDLTISSGSTLGPGGGVGAPPTFNNSGVIVKVGGAVTSINVPFVHSGLVHAQGGSLNIGGPLTSTGAWTAEAGQVVDFTGTAALNAGTTLRGAGFYRVTNLTTVTGLVPVDHAEVSGFATLSGPGTLRADASLTWIAGTIGGGGGRIEVPPGAALSLQSANNKSLSACTLDVAGATAWTGGTVLLSNAAVVRNSGVFVCQSNNSFNASGGAPARFDNTGEVSKSAATGVTAFNIAFNNAGRVRVQSGSFHFGELFTQTAGQTELAGGSISAGQALVYAGGEILGAGTISASVNSSGASMTPGGSPGAVGTIAVSSQYTQGPGGTLTIDVAGPTQSDRLLVGSIANLGGTLRVRVTPGAAIYHGTTWTILSSPDRRGTFAALDLPHGCSVEYTPTAVVLHASCDADVNQDGNIDQDDFGYLIDVIGGGPNPTGADPDFNGDGNVDQDDADAILGVIAGAPCP